jgi:two-component system chemotaxis response regulator CheB
MEDKKVMVVDDSVLIRKVLTDLINSLNGYKVVATASNGAIAVSKVKFTDVDIITMDVEMPEMNGIEAVKEILKIKKIPIIMVSSLTSSGSRFTIDALEAGAIDFVLKPAGGLATDMDMVRDDLKSKLDTASMSKVGRVLNIVKHAKVDFSSIRGKFDVVVVASSTGGPAALEAFLPGFSEDFPCPIVVVQHMPEKFTKFLAERLDKICALNIAEVGQGDKIKAGNVYIAPGNYHLELKRNLSGVFASLNQAPREESVRPCANVMIRSAVDLFDSKVLCVVLTGMGKDGTNGARKVKERGGVVLAQSEKSSVIYGMPKSVVEEKLADEVVDLSEMSSRVVDIIKG